MRDWKYFFIVIIFFIINQSASADYTPIIQNPNDGYRIVLQNGGNILTGPYTGSNGNKYYRIGFPIDIRANSPGVSVSGTVKCLGQQWNNNKNELISASYANHRVFPYLPKGPSIEGYSGYVINENIVMTIESKYLGEWGLSYASVCSSTSPSVSSEPVTEFTAQFPIVLSFYLNEKIIDTQIPIPAMDLAGYVRAFTRFGFRPSLSNVAIGQSTAPIRLAASVINVESSCSTTTSTGQANIVNLRHGVLSTLNYDSYVSEKVTYTCKFTKSTPVKFRLNYTMDNDPQKRLPMTNSENNKIYSELLLIDDSTGQSGKELKVNIDEFQTITIQSHVKGNTARSGDYNGSAWLIGTFD